MLTRFKIKSFKSIVDQEIKLPRLTVLFGPNAAGKSNFIDALQCLSRLVTERTLNDALSEPIRGNPVEFFQFPKGGLVELYSLDSSFFEFEADIAPKTDTINENIPDFRYRIKIGIVPKTGKVFVADEYLQHFTKTGRLANIASKIEKVGNKLFIRASGKGAPKREEEIGQAKTVASDRFYSGKYYRTNEYLRREMHKWKTYYLDPRVSMRKSTSPIQVSDIGVLGENLAPLLYRMQNDEPKYYNAVKRKLCSIIPSVDNLKISLDENKGEINIQVIQDNIAYSTRVISEGTLRILALCAISMNPWGSSLIAFEEPENGVHPRRLELITDLLTSLAIDGKKQLIITTHSPKLCQQIIEKKRVYKDDISMKVVKKKGNATVFEDFDPETLLVDEEIREAFTSKSEDGIIIEEMIMRGFVDG